MVNPNMEEYKKWVANVIRTNYGELKSVTTEWVMFGDTDGEPIAIVPKLTLEFKNGSDYAREVIRESDSVYSAQIKADVAESVTVIPDE